MIKRLEGIQKGQEVYLVPSDSRCTPQYAEVYSVGPKYIKLTGVNISLREFFSEDGRSALKMEDLLNGEDGNFSFQRNPMKNTKNYFHLGHR